MKRFLFLIGCWCSVSWVFALDNFTLKLGSTVGNGWQAQDVVVQLRWLSDTQVALTLDIAVLTLPEFKQPLHNLKLECQRTQYNTVKIACSQARLYLGQPWLDNTTINLSFIYDLSSQKIDFKLKNFVLAEGNVSLQANSAPSGWQVDLYIKGVNLEKLITQLDNVINIPQSLNLQGNIYLQVKLTGQTNLVTASLQGQITNLHFSNDTATQAGEKLIGHISLTARLNPTSSVPSTFQIQGTLTIKQGEVYIAPVYVKIEPHPIIVTVDLTWQSQQLQIHHLAYIHTEILTLQGSGEFIRNKTWAIKTLSIQLLPTSLTSLYHHYLQTLLGSDSQWSQLDVIGMIQAQFDQQADGQQLVVKLQKVSLENQRQSFGIADLNGVIQWHSHASDLPTQLSWSRAYFASKVELGASQLRVSLIGNRIELLTPWHQSLLDGSVHIEQFSLANLGTKTLRWRLQGRLESISLSLLSTALGGPVLNGQLTVAVPPLSYNHKRLEIHAPLRVPVFGGEVVVRTLTLEAPFGNQSHLTTDIDIIKLNLQTLTQITEFGEIQGQLSGYVRELNMINWQPKSFDAHVATPQQSRLPRKISQKAINNLSNLGGGAAVNAISRSVLSIFENFSYDRIGWGCRLANGICQMQGVEPAPKGYYIVKGGGLPRIDMIGYNTNVDWQVLLTRLKRISNVSPSH